MKPSEIFALQAFEAIEPESVLRYIEDQSTSVHDFAIGAADGSVGALEVTSFHDVAMTRAHRAIQSQRHGGAVAESRFVRHGWWIHPHPSANMRAVRSRADAYLARIEAEGRSRFFYGLDAIASPAVSAIHSDLQIEAGSVVKWKTPRQIRIALPSKGTLVSSANVLQMIRTVSHLTDNRAKLAASECVRRVLFIEIDANAYDQWAPFVREAPPAVPPDLPDEVSEVWAAARIGPEGAVWRWKNGAWSDHVFAVE